MRRHNVMVLGILCTAALLAGCGPSRPNNSGPSGATGIKALLKDSAGHEIGAGDTVMLTKMGYGCKSRNMLARAIEEQNLDKFLALKIDISNFPECITQGEFPHQHWTVTAVHPPPGANRPGDRGRSKDLQEYCLGLEQSQPAKLQELLLDSSAVAPEASPGITMQAITLQASQAWRNHEIYLRRR